MSLYFTPELICRLFLQSRHTDISQHGGPHRFTTRVTNDEHGITREMRCYDQSGKMVWNAFTVDHRNLTDDDLHRVCINRGFSKTALVRYPGYNLAVFDPQKVVGTVVEASPHPGSFGGASPNRAAMFAGSQQGRMLSNAMHGGFGVGYPTQPGFFPNGPGDFPMSPQFGDFQFPHPMAPRDPNHRGLPHPHVSMDHLTKDIPSAEKMLVRTLGVRSQVFYHNLMHSLANRIENPQTWTSQDPVNDDLQFHSGFMNTDIGAKGYAVIQALVTRRLKKLGYDVVFYGDHDNFTVVVSIDL